jgi:hypothetical protein
MLSILSAALSAHNLPDCWACARTTPSAAASGACIPPQLSHVALQPVPQHSTAVTLQVHACTAVSHARELFCGDATVMVPQVVQHPFLHPPSSTFIFSSHPAWPQVNPVVSYHAERS